MGYMGAKSGAGVYHAIIATMPPHDTYLEPFAGSGAVEARKPPAARSILLDKSAEAAARLARRPGVTVICGDGLAYLAALDPAPLGRLVIYADPPYLLSTRTGRRRYEHEFSEADHITLATSLTRLAKAGAAVIVSGYPSQLYDSLYATWRTREFQAMTRGGVRTEKLWLSFQPGAMHWATYAGRNFVDRQRIKRKAARWAARFAALPPAERQAVLAALLAQDPPSSEKTMGPAPATIDAGDHARAASSGPIDESVYGDVGRHRQARL